MPLLTDSKDLDDEIASDWADIVAKHQLEEPEVVEELAKEPLAGAPSKEVAKEPASKETKARDESGKFVKTPKEKSSNAKDNGDGKPADGVSKSGTVPAADGQPTEAQVGADWIADAQHRDVNRAPSTWRPTARAEWDKLSPTIKAEIHRRESDFMSGQSQLLPDAKLGKAISTVMEPYRMMLQSENATPEMAVSELMRTAAVFRVGTQQQKYQELAKIANQFGLDLRVFAPKQPQPGQQPTQPFQDPRVDQLLGQIRQFEMQRAARDQQVAQQEQQQTYSTADHWMNEKDAQGNPLRPYAADVIEEMTALIPQLKQANPALSHADALQNAYERACWAHPEVRALLQAEQQEQSQQKLRADSQTRVREARRAASVNVPRRASTPAPAKPGRMEETIEETARELGLIA